MQDNKSTVLHARSTSVVKNIGSIREARRNSIRVAHQQTNQHAVTG
jgi:hypothetical protein